MSGKTPETNRCLGSDYETSTENAKRLEQVGKKSRYHTKLYLLPVFQKERDYRILYLGVKKRSLKKTKAHQKRVPVRTADTRSVIRQLADSAG